MHIKLDFFVSEYLNQNPNFTFNNYHITTKIWNVALQIARFIRV